MTTKKKTNARLTKELLEMAKGMHASGIMTGEDIRALRTKARLSQAVFADLLNVTTGYVSQLERGTKRPTGAALVLLNVIRRKGIAAIL
jgi:putative transcriptional regulator